MKYNPGSINDEQRAAVEHQTNHPCAIIAGAGSGKTRVLTTRVPYLVDKEKITPRRVLCLTFTNKAAGEMRERLQFEDDGNSPKISTIHSLALNAIRRAPKGFGLDEKISLIDDYDQKQLVKKLIEERKLEDILKNFLVLEKISYHRARGVGFREDYTDKVHEQALFAHGGYHALSEDELLIWQLYQAEKKRQSVLDFDDMLHLVVRRGNEDEKWRGNLQKVYDHVLMDECQDTNVVQWAFVNLLLSPENRNIFVVGDVSQSIYGFNGACPDILYDFCSDWRGLVPSVYKLEKNYRSVPEVVKLANKTQKFMTKTIPLHMSSHRGEQGERGQIVHRKSSTPKELAASISEEIWRKIRDGEKPRDMAILIRSGSQVRDVEMELVRNKIPYSIRGTAGLMQTEEVKDVLSYLRLLTNPKDFMALTRSISVPKRGIGDVALEKIRTLANQNHEGNLLEAIKSYGHAKFSLFVQLLESLDRVKGKPLEALEHVIKGTNYASYLRDRYKKDQSKVEDKLVNLERLKDVIASLVAENELSLEDIVFHLTMQDQKDTSPEGKVLISTIHSSKGLEWKYVWLVGLYEGSLPHKWSTSEEEREEERRIFYVACTRAKDFLVLGVPTMIEYYNKGTQFVAPSRFLIELGVE